jgi:hypothetical protein
MMNDETEQFERHLSRQPIRQVPPEWREEILSAAYAAQASCRSSPAQYHGWFAALKQRLTTLLWPHPKAWAGMAAVWVLILAADFSMRDPATGVAEEKYAPPSPEVIVELKKQQQMLAELVGTYEPLDAVRQKIFSPKPRSECAEFMMT